MKTFYAYIQHLCLKTPRFAFLIYSYFLFNKTKYYVMLCLLYIIKKEKQSRPN